MAASAAALTSPSTTAETDSANVSPSAPLLLLTAANPGLGRSRDQCPSSPLSSTRSLTPTHYPPRLAMCFQPHPRLLSVLSHLAPPTPALALPSANPTNNEINHLHDDRSPTSSSSQAQHSFHHDFVSKMQAKYRTLDTHRVPRVQPLQFSAHTDRTAATQLLVQ